MLKDIILIAICDQYDANIFLVTNGTLLKIKHFDSLLHPRFYQINFSLHSFFDNYPDRDPSKYLDTIFNFTDRALLERPELYLNYRLWNLDDSMGKNSRNTEMLNRIYQHYQSEVPSKVDVRKKKSINIKDRLYLHFDTEFIWPSLDLNVLGTEGKCYGLSSHFGLVVDGTVVPCCLDKEGEIALGKVQENSIKEILNSPKVKAIIQGFQQRKLIEPLCQRCQYIERFKPKQKSARS